MHADLARFFVSKTWLYPVRVVQLHFLQLHFHFSHLHKSGRRAITILPFRHPLPKLSGPGGNARVFFCLRSAGLGHHGQYAARTYAADTHAEYVRACWHPFRRPLRHPPLQTGTTLPTFHSVGIIRKGFPWQMQTQ